MKQHVRRYHSETGVSPRINNRMDTNKRDISAPRRKLLEVMQDINFGRIEGLQVREGEPVFDPPPRVIREIKFGGDNFPRPEIASGDFTLKSKVLELFTYLDGFCNGTVETIEIKHGLPFNMKVEALLLF